jgi:hypothetical protein
MLNISHGFDFGRVFVKLYGSEGLNQTEPLAVHFWITRKGEDDN